MIMAAEKRKSIGGNAPPNKFVKNQQQGRSPGGGGGQGGGGGGNKSQGKKPFGGSQQQKSPGGPQQKSPGGGPQQQPKGGSPPKQQQQNKPKFQKGQQPGKKNVPPPPPAGAKKIEVAAVEATTSKTSPPKPQQKQQKGKGNENKQSPLNQVSKHSKNIHKKAQKKNRFQRFTDKLATKPRPAGACERALKAEQELGHGGRVYLIKVNDPPITEELVKSWNVGIETAVFSRPVDPRQFLVIFKHDADVKKGVEALKKTKFAGSNITVEEKLDTDVRVTSNPDLIDPFCLYVTNIHGSATKEDVHKLFSKSSTITQPRKHNPKIGSSSKFCFVAFETANDALVALKDNYNATLSGNTIVMRFRRVSPKEQKALEGTKNAAAEKPAKANAPDPAQTPKKESKQPIKPEPEDSEDDEEEGDAEAGAEKDSDEDDDEEELGIGEEDDSDDDDDEDLDDDDDDDEDEDDEEDE